MKNNNTYKAYPLYKSSIEPKNKLYTTIYIIKNIYYNIYITKYKMINTQILELAIKIALYTAVVKNENPVSIMLVAPVEHGKTEILKKFAFINTVKIISDFNTFMFADFATEYQMNQKATIVIPDFLRIVKKKYSTQSNALTILNAITEEGWMGKLPLGQTISKPIKANVITALTQDEMMDKRHKWAKLGFLSRFIPMSFSYNNATKQQIREYIKDRIYHTDKIQEFELDMKNKIDVVLPKDLAQIIEEITLNIAEKDNLTGFRLQRQLQVMCMGCALMNTRSVVNISDVEIIQQISEFINFNFKQI